ncbi:MAG: 30S ribosome-binding factor RbfA [Bacteroidales bacterium]|jgi:ribosome-binding factor A|nr:30S ribosome-binding factor RbfA [Bacteroidales bacterium]
MNSTRQQKIASLLQKELANIFLQDSKSLYNCMITVTKTTITSDLSIARAYLSIYMAPDKDVVIKAIRENTKDIRFRLGQQIRNQLRVVPHLEFFIDDTLDYMEHIDSLLKK